MPEPLAPSGGQRKYVKRPRWITRKSSANHAGVERGKFNWNEVSSAARCDAIDCCTRAGAGILFTVSRDGGAGGITVYGLGPAPRSVWDHDPATVEAALLELVEELEPKSYAP